MSAEKQMAKVNKLMEAIAAANLARAAEFAAMFPNIKVTPAGVKGGAAMAAYHNDELGWGFTAQFITSQDGQNHIHAFIEFVGPENRAEDIANQFKKIVGS